MGLPLLVALWAYPLAWLLGLELMVWPLVAVLLVVELVRWPRPILAPRAAIMWVAFLVWNVASLVLITEPERISAWAYRFAHYGAALVIIVFVVSVTERELPTARLSRAVVVLWGSVVVGGYVGLAFPDISFPSLMALVAPESLTSITFIRDSIFLEFGVVADYAGGTRPSTLFTYTNEWAAGLGLLTPLALYGQSHLATVTGRVVFWGLMAASIPPIVISVNRGLWVSLVVMTVVGGGLLLINGYLKEVAAIATGVAAVATIAYVSPLSQTIQNRLFSDEARNLAGRESLIEAAIDKAIESPLLGYGAPVTDRFLRNLEGVSVGTHGQLWTLLVSFGFVATALYVGFFVGVLWTTRACGRRGIWLQAAIVVLLVQAFFYSSTPMPLILSAVAVGLLLREARRVGPSGSSSASPAEALPAATRIETR